MSNIIYLTGATASGKTAVAIALARRIGAEIVSMDSMSIYRGMEIGTAAPNTVERAAVPHHLIGFLDPRREYSVAEYLADAQATIAGIEERGHRTLFVGGTPLYLKALLRGVFEGPPANPDFREAMRLTARQSGRKFLHERLREVDPVAAGRLHPNDERRIIRALEVFHTTGAPISKLQRQFDTPVPRRDCRVFVLDWPREILYDRIDRRVVAMCEAGLLDEARRLWEWLQPFPKATAAQAVGYRELFEHFRGEIGLDEAIRSIQRHSRQFAKRQGTWFRSLSECRFLSVEPHGGTGAADGTIDVDGLVQRIVGQL